LVLPLPFPETDELGLADWLEVLTLSARDGNASSGDLERALQRSGALDNSDRNAIEEKCLQVFNELEKRAASAGDSYPFTLKWPVVEQRNSPEDHPAYIFCLCLSYNRWIKARSPKFDPRRMFEDLSYMAAKNYLGGEAVRFAHPRTTLPSSFKDAVHALCTLIGEGGGWNKRSSLSSKDSAIDVIAWRHFPDRLPGKVILFGQCASGINWHEKVNDLQPQNFAGEWMVSAPVSPLLRSFFIPYRVDAERWDRVNRSAGILFDRCRIAYWIHKGAQLENHLNYTRWCKLVIGKARGST
jgi:hypothetical protein